MRKVPENIRIFRLLSLSAAFIVPAFCFMYDYTNAQSYNPMSHRFIIMAMGLCFYAISFTNAIFRFYKYLLLIQSYTIFLWSQYILHKNQFSFDYILGFIIILFAVTFTYDSRTSLRWGLAISTIVVIVNCLISDTLYLDEIVFISSIIAIHFLAYMFNSSRLKAVERARISKALVEEQNKNMKDSISYASHIQNAILPSKEFTKLLLNNSFVFLSPRDVLSGDFYWLEKKDDLTLFAVVDCTGHGVPGALVSIVGEMRLNKIVNELNITDPSLILDLLNELVVDTLGIGEGQVNDGMDISLCTYNERTRVLEFAGANNPIYLIRNKFLTAPENLTVDEQLYDYNLYELKANKKSIGHLDYNYSFSKHTIQLEPEDTIYLFSDGFADQFGGGKGKKLRYKGFKELLLSIQSADIDKQEILVSEFFNAWKGDMDQVDDICIMGFRV